jgi:mannose-6-phosphate isomerase-like protein (cupin superfamily)
VDCEGEGVTTRAVLALFTLAAALGCADPANAQQTQRLAEGPVMLAPGGSFLSIGYLPQPPGGSFGPHGHVPGLVYALSGDVTVADNGSTLALNAGDGHFIPALAVHTHENTEGRLPAGALAIGLVLAVIALVLVVGRPRLREALVPVLLVALIVGGAVALQDPWKNEWFFYGIRPEPARGAVMPLPSASRTYESPQFRNLSPGRYLESLATTTVDPRGEVGESTVVGPIVFLVLDGEADVTVGNEEPVRLGRHEATMVQRGESFRVVNPSGSELRLLRFALTPSGSTP